MRTVTTAKRPIRPTLELIDLIVGYWQLLPGWLRALLLWPLATLLPGSPFALALLALNVIGDSIPSFLIAAFGVGLALAIVGGAFLGGSPLKVNLEADANSPTNEKWWNLLIENGNRAEAKSCYVKVLAYSALNTTATRPQLFPKGGTLLAWRANPGGTPRETADIPGHSYDYADLAMGKNSEEVYWTPLKAPPNLGAPILLSYPLPPGRYLAEIEIGSASAAIPKRVYVIELSFWRGKVLDAAVREVKR